MRREEEEGKREGNKPKGERKNRADGNTIYTTPTAILQEAKKPRRRMKNKEKGDEQNKV